jgi:hypothetical protein
LCVVLCGVNIITLAIYAGYNIFFNIKFNQKQVKLERQNWELKKEIEEVERVNGKEKKDIEELKKEMENLKKKLGN